MRELRKAARLTLDDVAAASGISRAALSKIERGEMSPTYESLLKVAKGLKTDLAVLITERGAEKGGYEVTRAGGGSRYRQDQFVHHLLAPGLRSRTLNAFVTDVPAIHVKDYGPWHSHESEDFLYALEGTIVLHLEGEDPIELKPGDSIQVDGRIPHALVAKKGKARLLWVSTSYR